MQLQQQKYQGLVADLLPNIRWMQGCGHFLFKFTSGPVLMRKIYAFTHLILCVMQFVFIIMNMVRRGPSYKPASLMVAFLSSPIGAKHGRGKRADGQHSHNIVLHALVSEAPLLRPDRRQFLHDAEHLEPGQRTPVVRRV